MSVAFEALELASTPLRLIAGIDSSCWSAVMTSLEKHWSDPRLRKPYLVTVVDFTRPAKERRLWLLNLFLQAPLVHSFVAHGKNSGAPGGPATKFSNTPGTHMSCVGGFATCPETYKSSLGGVSGLGLKVHGLDAGTNHKAKSRGIVFHGAKYVTNTGAGRSHGCFSTMPSINEMLLPLIAGGSFVFAFGGK